MDRRAFLVECRVSLGTAAHFLRTAGRRLQKAAEGLRIIRMPDLRHFFVRLLYFFVFLRAERNVL